MAYRFRRQGDHEHIGISEQEEPLAHSRPGKRQTIKFDAKVFMSGIKTQMKATRYMEIGIGYSPGILAVLWMEQNQDEGQWWQNS